jgi:hypothetical protein
VGGANESVTTLRLIGYWLGQHAPGWPDVRAFVDRAPDRDLQARVARYLRGGTMFVATAGVSFCRLCGAANGSTELTDGVNFVWPEGLAHYVEAHAVRLPAEVVDLMEHPPEQVDVHDFERRLLDTHELTIDNDWWRTVGSS